ncbi:MAG: NAD-dependent epimerase/dehydratase family protein [Phycisphaeraceae bacterium]
MTETQDSKRNERVLVTGSAGTIGGPVCDELRRRGYQVRGFDARPTEGLEDSLVGDIADRGAIDRAMRGCDSVVHLAAEVRSHDIDFIDHLLQPNIVGVYNILETAREQNLRRVVLASSIHTVNGHFRNRDVFEHPIGLEDGPAPRNHYGVTKVWAEELGAMYARRFEMSVVAVRIAWLPRSQQEAEKMQRGRGVYLYLSYDDAGRCFAQAVATSEIDFGVLFAANPDAPYDLEPGKRLINFVPQDRYPQGMPFVIPERTLEQD